MAKLKKIIKRNQLYISFFSQVLLGIMALTVSICQLYITNLQIDVEKKINSPHITVYSTIHQNENNKDTIDDTLVIVNDGGEIYETSCTTAVFLIVDLFTKEEGENNYQLAIQDYYSDTINSFSTTGLILTKWRYGNYSKFMSLDDALSIISDEDNSIYNISIQRYVKVSYKDNFDNNHEVYYQVDLVHPSTKISTSAGREIFSNYDKLIYKGSVFKLFENSVSDLPNMVN